MKRGNWKLLAPAGVLAGTLLAVACGPPPVNPPPGGTTTTTTSSTTTTTVFTSPPHLYAETPLNGWGQDGIANSVDIQGNTVFVGGEFGNAVRGGQSVPRGNVMAVSRSTGDLLPFVADTDGIVRVVLSDGVSTYIGGDFTTVNGVPRGRLAKVNAVTGALDTSFSPNIPTFVTDLVLAGNRLYVVGQFGQVNGVQRRGAALLDKRTGALDPTFSPNAQARVNTAEISPDGAHLYLGLAGAAAPFLLDVNPVTGATQGPNFSLLSDYIRDVAVGPDGTVYVAAGGKMNSAIAISPTTGRQRWRQRAEGDVQAVKVSNGYAFFGFHDGFTVNGVRSYTLRILAANPDTGALEPGFMPQACCYPGVLTIDADGTYLAVGGLYGRMGGRAAHGVSIHP